MWESARLAKSLCSVISVAGGDWKNSGVFLWHDSNGGAQTRNEPTNKRIVTTVPCSRKLPAYSHSNISCVISIYSVFSTSASFHTEQFPSSYEIGQPLVATSACAKTHPLQVWMLTVAFSQLSRRKAEKLAPLGPFGKRARSGRV